MWFECQLARRKKVRMGALVDAMTAHFESRLPLGRLALKQRKLSMKQLFSVLESQAESGAPFGRIAVELGFLTEADVAELLMLQSDLAKPVGDLLIEAGAISRETYEVELARFRATSPNDDLCAASPSKPKRGDGSRPRPTRRTKKRAKAAL